MMRHHRTSPCATEAASSLKEERKKEEGVDCKIEEKDQVCAYIYI